MSKLNPAIRTDSKRTPVSTMEANSSRARTRFCSSVSRSKSSGTLARVRSSSGRTWPSPTSPGTSVSGSMMRFSEAVERRSMRWSTERLSGWLCRCRCRCRWCAGRGCVSCSKPYPHSSESKHFGQTLISCASPAEVGVAVHGCRRYGRIAANAAHTLGGHDPAPPTQAPSSSSSPSSAPSSARAVEAAGVSAPVPGAARRRRRWPRSGPSAWRTSGWRRNAPSMTGRRRASRSRVGRGRQSAGPRASCGRPTARSWPSGTCRATVRTRRWSCSPTAGAAATRSGSRSPAASANRDSASCSTTSAGTGRARGARRR